MNQNKKGLSGIIATFFAFIFFSIFLYYEHPVEVKANNRGIKVLNKEERKKYMDYLRALNSEERNFIFIKEMKYDDWVDIDQDLYGSGVR